MVDLVPDDGQRQIRESVRAFLDDRAPIARLHAPSSDLALWREIGALGWFGLGLPEEDGGLGLGACDEMYVAIECGRALLSPAFVGTVIGARLATLAGDATLAAAIVAGERSVGIGIARGGRREDAGGASVLLVDTPEGSPFCIWRPDGIGLYPWGVLSDVAPVTPLDEATSLSAAMMNVRGAIAATHDATLPARADMLVSAMLAGLADRAIAPTVSYALTREQFGRPIGGFQAIKHRCADMVLRSTAAASQTLFAALAMDGGLPTIGREASAARIIGADAAAANAASMVQIHGGIGYTDDCDAHLLVKRAQLLSRIGGDVRLHERRLLEED